jgi:hypothetical protein
MPVAPYGSTKYRDWNRERMRRRRTDAAQWRRELNLQSIRRVSETITKYEALLNEPAAGAGVTLFGAR